MLPRPKLDLASVIEWCITAYEKCFVLGKGGVVAKYHPVPFSRFAIIWRGGFAHLSVQSFCCLSWQAAAGTK